MKKWNQVLLSASRTLLKCLKNYHRDAISLLTGEITVLRAGVQSRQDFNWNIAKIENLTRQVIEKCEIKKVKKIKKLLGEREKKKCRRKKKLTKQPNKPQVKVDNKTVVNISNVPLSNDELDLLSRGLLFCPRPSHTFN